MSVFNKLITSEDNSFGPSTDLMVTLVAVMLVLYSNTLREGILNKNIVNYQVSTIKKLSNEYASVNSNTFNLTIECDGKDSQMKIINDGKNQIFTFSGDLIFLEADTTLKVAGQNVLKCVFEKIFDKPKIPFIKEIQILGHADNQNLKENAKKKYKDNLTLASFRAMVVYNFLVKELGISPLTYRISATSYSKYKPVFLKEEESLTEELLLEYNKDQYSIDQNRRIEVVLRYKNVDERWFIKNKLR